MTTLADHARSMIGYNAWANERILAAAGGLTPDAYAQIADTLRHTLATQRWWLANWTHGAFAEPAAWPLAEMRAQFARSDADLLAFAQALTDGGWDHAEPWWAQWGYADTGRVGQMIFQVVYHGIQHRAEIAVILTERGHSPGDLDYLQFLFPHLA